MKVRAVVSFTSMVGGELQPWPVGHVAELPEGVNWLKLGWVVEVEAETEVEQESELEPDRPRAAKRPAKKKVSDGG